LARRESVDIVLLSGDLLDSDNTYYETGEKLVRCLGQIPAPVFIAPGNHDYYSPKSPYAKLKLPENVHVFTGSSIEAVELPGLNTTVYGAAFVDKRSKALLSGFTAERQDEHFNLMCIHGEVGAKDSAYNPISLKELADSGMDYVALGHIHKASGLQKSGNTWYSWPGCPEGRGFDETGEKFVSLVELSDKGCALENHSIASRRYEIITVDVTGTEPLLAIHTQLPDETVSDIYRIVLTGETEDSPDINRLYSALSEMFFELQIRDETRLRRSVWERAGEDTLRGLFLMKLRQQYDEAKSDEQRRQIEQAARWGLAALDNMEEVVSHENK
jgi:DNA repair exonuclease SbcCD nuclease subunit